MIEFLEENWPFIVSIAAVIGALVVFGKNLADLILKWRDVFRVPGTKKQTTESSMAKNNEDGESQSIIRNRRFEAVVKSKDKGNIQQFRLRIERRELEYREVLLLWESDEEF